MRLGDRCLWQDEAETALLGKNILRFGRPIAFDGTNVVSQEASKELAALLQSKYKDEPTTDAEKAAKKTLEQEEQQARLERHKMPCHK